MDATEMPGKDTWMDQGLTPSATRQHSKNT